jgi:putative ABC transport system permease protein
VSGRVPVGRRNLFSERRRGLLGIAGTAAALLLVLAIDAIFDGAMRQITRYIDTQPVQVFVAQSGVRNLHMASSSVPLERISDVANVDGVRAVDPILFAQEGLDASVGGRRLAYLFGYVPGRPGGPVEMETGVQPDAGEIVLDAATADSLGVGVADTVDALGRPWRISGLAENLSNIANGIAFVRLEDFQRARGVSGTTSYLLVTTDREAGRVAAAIERETGLAATTREGFSASEHELVSDMSGEVLRIVSGAAWLVGFTVVALTLYAATRSRLRDIGVMTALGAGRTALWRIVLTQAGWTVGLAGASAGALTFALVSALAASSSSLSFVLEPRAVARTTAISAAVAAAASIAPLIKVSRLDPASVFRR